MLKRTVVETLRELRSNTGLGFLLGLVAAALYKWFTK
jgi:hypothetical protein